MLIVKRHPIGEKEVIEVAPNRAVIEYLTDYDDCRDLEVDVYLNGGDLLTKKDYKRTLKEGDILTLAYRPGTGIEVAIVAALVSAVVLVSLIPKPEVPNVVGETSSSPNNSVSGQTNTVRKYEAIPNIYGRVISYPDLIANAVPEWISNRKQVRELFLIGEGDYQVNEVRDVKTSIDDIPSSSYVIYGSEDAKPDFNRIQLNDSITGQDLLAYNDPSLAYNGSFRAYGNISGNFAYSSIASNTINFTVATSLVAGDVFSITSGARAGTYTVDTNGAGFSIKTVEAITDDGSSGNLDISSTRNRISLNSSAVISNMSLEAGSTIYIQETISNNGTYEISSIAISGDETSVNFTTGQMITEGAYPSTSNILFTTLDPSAGAYYVGWFDMPTESEQIWVNLSCSSGLQDENGDLAEINITIEYQPVDLSTSIQTATTTFSGLTRTELGKTIKITVDSSKIYRIRAKRTNSKYSGNAIDTATIDQVFNLSTYSSDNFGNVTVMDVVTKAGTSSTTSSRKINADVTRKLNGVATTNFADAVKDLIVNKGRRPESEIDLVGLYDISDNLSDDLKEFSFTFDDKNISLAQAVQTVCNVSRVNVYRDGQMWRFNRDEAKPRTYVFNRRNLASGDNQKYTQSVRLPNDYDSVSLRYYNRDLESFDNVLIRIDAGTQSFVLGEDGARPYEIELAGCSNYAQALNRANLEARKIVYLRRSVEDVALIDAANVDIGDRVAWCDIYDGETMDGEIVGQDGSTFYTSEEIVLENGITYYAMITDEDGQAMTPVEVSAVAGNSKAFTATLAGNVLIADNYLVQSGSKYVIGSVDDLDDTDYSVVSRGGNENGRISIELIQYSDNIYEAD